MQERFTAAAASGELATRSCGRPQLLFCPPAPPLPPRRFDAWLREAALQLAGGGEAPWRRWKAEAQAAALRELLAEPCLHDARRFKRLLKVGAPCSCNGSLLGGTQV